MEQLFAVHFKGHPNVRATNTMTLEVTREDFLTLRGDCIIGVMADKACQDLDQAARAYLMNDSARLRLVVEVEGDHYEFSAQGSSALTLTHPISMVVRKSTYTCFRTLAVKSEAAACDVPRPMVAKLAAGADGVLVAYRAAP